VERWDYRPQQADIYNFMAEMAFAEGEMAKARKYAEMAKERAFCDGPPYCYKKALDEAEEKLKVKRDKGKIQHYYRRPRFASYSITEAR
jgi:hypothetical protein